MLDAILLFGSSAFGLVVALALAADLFQAERRADGTPGY